MPNFTSILLSTFIMCAALPFAAVAQLPETSNASYYAEEFHGKATANGEVYSMWQMTAAHRTLPFDTKVRVVNLDNGKSTIVRINDRGPFMKGRIIDLSKAAAAEIGMVKPGTAQVRLESADPNQPLQVEPGEYYAVDVAQKKLKGFGIQIASYKEFDNLVRKLDLLQKNGLDNLHVQVASMKDDVYYRIVIASFDSREDAEKRLAQLASKIKNGFVFELD